MWNRIRQSPMIATLSRFSATGLLATITYFVVANLAISAGIAAVTASIVGYLAGMVVSFLGQGGFTFRVKSRSTRHLVRFLVLSAIGLAISWGSIEAAFGLGIDPRWGTIVTSVLVPVLNFIVMKNWVFVEKPLPLKADG